MGKLGRELLVALLHEIERLSAFGRASERGLAPAGIGRGQRSLPPLLPPNLDLDLVPIRCFPRQRPGYLAVTRS